MPKCFKCNKDIECAIQGFIPVEGEKKEPTENDIWEMPSGAVWFEGGCNFGSRLYDSGVNGVAVNIIVCDECIEAAKAEGDKIREVNIWANIARQKEKEKNNAG